MFLNVFTCCAIYDKIKYNLTSFSENNVTENSV